MRADNRRSRSFFSSPELCAPSPRGVSTPLVVPGPILDLTFPPAGSTRAPCSPRYSCRQFRPVLEISKCGPSGTSPRTLPRGTGSSNPLPSSSESTTNRVSQRASQKPSRPDSKASAIRDNAAGPDRLITPAMQHGKQPFWARLPLLARLTLNTWNYAANPPARPGSARRGTCSSRLAGASRHLHRLDAATKLPFLVARPIASVGSW